MLQETGRFKVTVARTEPKGTDPNFHPAFSDYNVVISNYNGDDWPEETKKSFEEFVSSGGGFVVVHAADNAFPNWPAYNRMIGLGGWGGRNEASGPWIYFDQAGKSVRDDSAGRGGSHGQQHEFTIEKRAAEHPIMTALPEKWLHAKDELYDSLRGPAENIEVLATAFSDPATGGTGRHEPVVMAIQFGEGRVFHTTLGHADYSMECADFVTLLQRGTEWAATGKVTLLAPQSHPAIDAIVAWPIPGKMEKADLVGSMVSPWRFANLILGGQPDQADFELLKKQGVSRVISLRRENEINWNEKEIAAKAGIEFENFPVGSEADFTDEMLGQLRQRLSEANASERVVLHCGRGPRVGAVFAAWRAIDGKVPVDTAFEEANNLGKASPAMQKRIREYIESETAKEAGK